MFSQAKSDLELIYKELELLRNKFSCVDDTSKGGLRQQVAGSYIDDALSDIEDAIGILSSEAERADEEASDQAEYERQHRLTGRQLGVA